MCPASDGELPCVRIWRWAPCICIWRWDPMHPAWPCILHVMVSPMCHNLMVQVPPVPAPHKSRNGTLPWEQWYKQKERWVIASVLCHLPMAATSLIKWTWGLSSSEDFLHLKLGQSGLIWSGWVSRDCHHLPWYTTFCRIKSEDCKLLRTLKTSASEMQWTLWG